MTRLRKKLTLLLITLFAAICLGAGLFLIPSASPSADDDVVTLSGNNHISVSGGVFTGLTTQGVEAVGTKKFKIEFPVGVTEIATGVAESSPANALFNRVAAQLVEIKFAGGGNLVKIGDYAFSGCSSLQKINLEDEKNLATVGKGAFKNCSSLYQIAFPSRVNTFAEELFSGCKYLDDVNVENHDITTVGDRAFENCYGLKSEIIDDLKKLTTIGNASFYGCSNFKNIVLPDTATDIGVSAFANCTGLESIKISNTITEIKEGTFANCTGLKRVYTDESDTTSVFALPSAISVIGKEAFSACIALPQIVIPSTVTKINERAFYSCSGATDIYFYAEMCSLGTSGNDTFASPGVYSDVTVHIGDKDGDIEHPVKQLPTSLFAKHGGITQIEFNNVNLNGVEGCGLAVFSGCSALEKVTFGKNCNISVLNENMFSDCINLTEIVGIENIKLATIGKQAFFNCRALRAFTVGAEVKKIDGNAFTGCFKLMEVKNLTDYEMTPGTLSDNYGNVAYYALRVYKEGASLVDTQTVEDYVFYNGSKLGDGSSSWLIDYTGDDRDITLPSGYISGSAYNIYQFAFFGKNQITTIDIPDDSQVKSIGEQAFANCTALTRITFPKTLLDVGNNMMQGCTSLTNVDFHLNDSIEMGVNVIKAYMFEGCTSLASITLPRNIVTIEHNAFKNCSSLVTVTFGGGLTGVNKLKKPKVESIGASAFENCTSLQLIEIPSSVTSVGQNTFKGCSALQFVYLPEKSTYGDTAFEVRSPEAETPLMLISASKESYNNDKDRANLNVNADNLTYVIKVTLKYDCADLKEGTQTIERLYNRDAGYERTGQGLSWNHSGNMPVQLSDSKTGTSFTQSVWYSTEGCDAGTVVDIEAFTELLKKDEKPIVLYARYITYPSLSAASVTPTYDPEKAYNAEKIFTELLREQTDGDTGPGVINAAQFSDYYQKYFQINVVSYNLSNGNKDTSFKWDPNGTIKDAGTYTLELKLRPEYGTWASSYMVDFKIETKIQDISKAVEWSTRSGTLGPVNPFSGDVIPTEAQVNKEATILYFDQNGTVPYDKPAVTSDKVVKYVLASCAAYNGDSTIEIILNWKGGKSYGTIVTESYTGNVGSAAGTYTATVLIQPDNNYRLNFTSDALTRALGLDFARAADGAVTVSKTWYIYVNSNNKLISSDGGDYVFGVRDEEGKLIDWTYNKVTNNQVPKIPGLSYGRNEINSLLSFSLEYNGEVVTESDEKATDGFVPYENDIIWAKYINRAMPAGDYVLTFKVLPFKDKDGNTYSADDFVYNFTVHEASVGNSDRKQIEDALKGKKAVEYSGEVTFIATDGFELFKKGNDVQVNSGAALGYWSTRPELYSGFTARYLVYEAGKDYPDKNYYTVQEFVDAYKEGSPTRAFPVGLGTYTVYYIIDAPNYAGEITGSYTLSITHTIGLITIPERSYTGVSVLPDIDALLRKSNSDKFDDYSFFDVYTLTEASQGITPGNFYQYSNFEPDDYSGVGTHYVFLKIKDIYEDYILWDVPDDLKNYGPIGGVNKTFVRIEFKITTSGNMETDDGRLFVNSWEYGMFTREANAPHWKLEFGDDYTKYRFQLISADGGVIYYFNGDPNAPLEGAYGFSHAPAGQYVLRAIAPAIEAEGIGEFISEISIEVKKATPTFRESPYIDSWNYGNTPNNIGLPDLSASLAGRGNEVSESVKIYYALRADYDKNTATAKLCASLDEFKNSESQVPAGEYYVIYRLSETDNFNEWEYKIRFKVMPAANSWKSLYMPDFDYVDYDTAMSMREIIPNFGDASRVVVQYRKKGVESGWRTLDNLLNIEGKLDIGQYEMRAILAATENFARMESVTTFTVSRAANKWIDVPSIRGWAEGNFNADKNGIKGLAALGTVEFTVTDEGGKTYSTHDLASLGIGTYKLTAKVAGTNNYDELVTEIYFDVIEDSVGMTGLIASTVVFSVLALGLAGAAIALLVLRNKKAEREFRKAVRNELRRK